MINFFRNPMQRINAMREEPYYRLRLDEEELKYEIKLTFVLKKGMFEKYFKIGLKRMQKLGKLGSDVDLDMIEQFPIAIDTYSKAIYGPFSKHSLKKVINSIEPKKNIRIAHKLAEITSIFFKRYEDTWCIEIKYEGSYANE